MAMAKAAFYKKKKTFHQPIALEFKEETSKVLHLECSCVWYWGRMKINGTSRVK
jgi:hypothetical protein